jgi:hypothetical protein
MQPATAFFSPDLRLAAQSTHATAKKNYLDTQQSYSQSQSQSHCCRAACWRDGLAVQDTP